MRTLLYILLAMLLLTTSCTYYQPLPGVTIMAPDDPPGRVFVLAYGDTTETRCWEVKDAAIGTEGVGGAFHLLPADSTALIHWMCGWNVRHRLRSAVLVHVAAGCPLEFPADRVAFVPSDQFRFVEQVRTDKGRHWSKYLKETSYCKGKGAAPRTAPTLE